MVELCKIKVVTTVARALRELNIPCVRFNYRGVGQSDGDFAKAIGETDDLLAVYQWLMKVRPKTQVILAGFSFGAFVSYNAQAKILPDALITIAPPIHHFNFNQQPVPSCPWILLQGEDDDVVPPQQVYQWVDTLTNKPKIIKFPKVTHFFHGHLIELREAIEQFIATTFNLKITHDA